MSELVEVHIRGHRIRIRTGADTNKEYIREVAHYVDEVMEELMDQSTGSSYDRIAVMAAIRIADSLFRRNRWHNQ
ncbi:MAG: cell division protein ZapA, partial [Magnetococcales bacterium]|nr:cell division protein ZapA [Magnetococcales bacterium]